MSVSGSLQLSLELGICRNHGRNKRLRVQNVNTRGPSLDAASVKNATLTLARSFNLLQGSPIVIKLASAVGILIFAMWGLGPLVRQSRNIFLHKSDSSWKKSSTYHVTTSYIQPLLLWAGAIFVCRALDPMILPTEAGQIVKQRLLNFVRSLSTVLAFAYCLSSLIQQAQKFFTETNDPADTRNMGFQFAGKAVYSAVWVAAVSLFMELLGFSTQKWLTAGGLGTVLLTLAGREIFTNFLSSAMIHATRPFVVNEWIQTKIEGYDVSGTVEHVGWWSPTIVRGEDREAVHIPNHKFTVNVVRNLSQKTHWRIKTHLAISHLDVTKINNIVADMRKVLAKNPQVEQQKLHRRVFLDNINSENQALMILVSCFVKTSHFEEYLCVKEAIFLDLLRVIRHHRARLATPIRTVQKIFSDADLDNIPFSDTIFNRGAAAASNRPLLLIEPSYKINGEDKTKTQARSGRVNGEEDSKPAPKPAPDNKVDAKSETTSDAKGDAEVGQVPKVDTKEDPKIAPKSSDTKLNNNTKSVKETSSSANKNPQKVGQENSSVSFPESGSKRNEGVSPNTSQLKHEVRQQVTQPQVTSKPSLEENIVLGVALEGSKRTLPIEEEMGPTPSLEDVKELATRRSGNGPVVVEKEKNDVKRPSNTGPSAVDQLDQQN
ncbi:hypothetical protein RD792_001074 [Penstemon davidsonii]|uniref:Mechanosensitive ion channel protein 2, chloroplastic-like n=1 Tax=Penstemon davidsonii TaxID=160366 RepID=A0ABR0DME2_9LAMI|nr:hypothetical protein RD792_001074 [Penstemon davidsonii]